MKENISKYAKLIDEKTNEEIKFFVKKNPSLEKDLKYIYKIGVPDRSKTYLMFEFAKILGVDTKKLEPYAICAELMMAAAMNDDDFIDDCNERWGRPAFWKVNGVNKTIITSAYMYSLIFSILKKYRPEKNHMDFEAHQKAESLMIDYFRIMHEGQYKTVDSNDKLSNLTMSDQEELATEKASLLLKFCTAVPAYFSNKYVDDMENIGHWIGVARLYRSDIRDYLEINTDSYKQGTRMEDFFTHQLNLVLVLTGQSNKLSKIEKDWYYKKWSNKIHKKNRKSVTEEVLRLIKKTGAIELAKKELYKVYTKLNLHLEKIPDSENKTNISNWVRESCIIDEK